MLVNLFANAVKFTGPGGRVAVAVVMRPAGPDGGHPGATFLRVADTGVGIARDQQAAVLEPFVQVRSGPGSQYTQAAERTGLGLAISRDLARGMGGDLRVRSTEGAGSAFTVTLRRVADACGRPAERRAGGERRDRIERRGSNQRGEPRDEPRDEPGDALPGPDPAAGPTPSAS